MCLHLAVIVHYILPLVTAYQNVHLCDLWLTIQFLSSLMIFMEVAE